MRALVLALIGLAGCHDPSEPDRNAAMPSLETAAIEAGVIPDPGASDVTGLYARDDDRLCIAPGTRDYRVGVHIDLGDQSCFGSGSAIRSGGETVALRLDDGCAFDATFEGDGIRFPATVPDACRRLCGERGSLAAVTLDRLSDAPGEAAAMTGPNGTKPCG